MILFDPGQPAKTCTESARIVDSVFVIMHPKDETQLASSINGVLLFRTLVLAERYRSQHPTMRDWGIHELSSREVFFLDRTTLCMSENE